MKEETIEKVESLLSEAEKALEEGKVALAGQKIAQAKVELKPEKSEKGDPDKKGYGSKDPDTEPGTDVPLPGEGSNGVIPD